MRTTVIAITLAAFMALVAGGATARVDNSNSGQEPRKLTATQGDHRGTQFINVTELPGALHDEPGTPPDVRTVATRDITFDTPSNEFVFSWNADCLPGASVKVEARALYGERPTAWYTMGIWSPDSTLSTRASVNGQRDADGRVSTDTLILEQPASDVQIRVTFARGTAASLPTLKLLGFCATDTTLKPPALDPDTGAWGHEVDVPSRAQYGYPDESGWCSPTSVTMVLALWSKRLARPELDMPVPSVAHAIFDSVYNGTGNWPFNTAFAGSLPGIRAYVTRLSDIRELEQWVNAGIPPVVSVSYDLLRGKEKDEDPGHLMVCDGFTANGDIVLNDPAHHPDRGQSARRVFPRANFLRGWARSKNLVYLIYPSGTVTPPDPFGHWTDSPPPHS